MKLSPTQKIALKLIADTRVMVTNSGSTNSKSVAQPTIRSLRTAKLIDLNGASRATIKGRSARRAVLTTSLSF